MNAPKYKAGSVIDIRFSHNTMPDRIYIIMVYQKENSTEWMYQVVSEKSNGITYYTESQIDKYISKKSGKCYETDLVKEMYNNGFRFCGNSKKDTAFNRANSMVNANYIKHIILADALDTDGNPIEGQLGLWVQYNKVIDTDYNDNKTYNQYVIK